ncbi:SLC13 family permease [Shouchella tritolerans]|uniref:SLC13 family permease n=1 Tax=Shouchella tritolerans TaxID=2979466 RepID=UPI0021E83F2D|nr:SLC13 family permease [Shouchella tritolerans]
MTIEAKRVRTKRRKRFVNSDNKRKRGKWEVLFAAVVLSLAVTPSELTADGRMSLMMLILAIYCWLFTALPPAMVALGALLLLVLTRAVPQELLFESLSSDVIWLMLGTFMIGACMQKTGLAKRMSFALTTKARSTFLLLFVVTIITQVLTLFIPSTSGRASVLLPLYRDLSKQADNERFTKALALLIPTVILLATNATLIGASSHLIANDYLPTLGHERISFVQWLIWGMPFAFLASMCACLMIGWLFLDKRARQLKFHNENQMSEPMTSAEKRTVLVIVAMMGLWLTEATHGVHIATVTIIGAFTLLMPKIGVIKWKEGVEAVSWNLLLYVGAAIALGEALMQTGAAEWAVQLLLEGAERYLIHSESLTIFFLIAICMSAHLYIPSHTTRAVILVPPLLALALAKGFNPQALLFMKMVALNYCLTFPISSKALLIYFEEKPSFKANDLFRLSCLLALVYFGLIVIFFNTYWRWTGLSL